MRVSASKPRPVVVSLARFTTRAAMLAALALAGTPETQAVTVNWNGAATDGLWATPGNWAGSALPGLGDTAQMNVNAATTISLGGSTQEVLGITFNQGSIYNITDGFLKLNELTQTANVANIIQPTAVITTKNSGADVLTAHVTQSQLSVQGQITSGGLVKTGAGILRLGTSLTAFNNAINGDINLNGGTLLAAAASTAGSNNPLGGTGGIVIGASGVTLQLSSNNVNYDFGRAITANDNSFTLTAQMSGGTDLGDYQMSIGTISIGSATLTTSNANGYQVRTDGISINSGATTTLQVNALTLVESLQGDATTKLVKNGGSDLRIYSVSGSPATTFAGDIDLGAGWLVLESNAASGQPLGAENATTQINIVGTGTTVSLRTDAAATTTFNNTDIFAGNNSFTYDVRNINTSLTNTQTMVGGKVTIGDATMTVGGDRHNLRISELNVIAGSTLTTLGVNNNTNAAQNLRIDALTGGGAGSVLRKTGGQTLTIGATAEGYTGNIEVTGGTLTVEAATGLVPTANVGSIFFNSGSNLNFRSNSAVDFVSDISFGSVTKNPTLSVDRISSGSAVQLRFGTVDVSPNPTLGERNVSFTSGNTFTYGVDRITAGTGNATVNLAADVTADGLTTAAGTTFTKRGGNTLTLNSNNLATSAGTLDLRAGTISATAAGALGTGTVYVGNPVATSAGFYTDFSRLRWGATGAGQAASGPDAIARLNGVIDLDVNPAATDTFEVQAWGRIQGSTAQLAALTVGSNLTLAEDAIIVHDNAGAGLGSVTGLANNKSYWYGLVTNVSSLPTIGTGTPWKGISGENSTARTIQGTNGTTPAIINIAGGDNDTGTVEAYFMSMNDVTLNIGAAGLPVTWTSTAAGGEKVTLGIRGIMGTNTLGLVQGGRVNFALSAAATNLAGAVDQIIVEDGSLTISSANGLGGVPVEVRDGGVLDIGGVAGTVLDGNVTIKSGGVFILNDATVLGNAGTTDEGTITIAQGGKLDMTATVPANIFTASAANGQTINFSGSGHTVRFGTNDIVDLDATVPNADVTFVVQGGSAAATIPETNLSVITNSQTAGLTLDGGTLTNDATSRGLSAPITLTANKNYTVAATRGTSFVVTSGLNLGTGDLQIGSTTAIDGRDKNHNSGATNFAGVADPFNSPALVALTGAVIANNITLNNSNLLLTNAGTQITGSITINGGVLYLDGGGSAAGTTGEFTSRLADGTFAQKITLNQNSRVEIGLALGSDGTRLEVNQAFVINGDINPQDNRSLYVTRVGTGTNTGVNLNNITLGDGAVFGGVNEANSADVRIGLKLLGNAIHSTQNANTNIDFNSVTRDASLPAYDGSNPVVLTQGRLNMNGWQTSNNTNTNVIGTIGTGVQIDMARGDLYFVPGSVLNGVVRTQTAPAGGTSFIRSSSNSSTNTFNTDTFVTGTGRIELGRSAAANGPEDMEIRGTEVTTATASVAPLHTHAGEIRIVNDGINNNVDGIIRSERANDSDRTARVAASNVSIETGATLQLTTSNGASLTVGQVSLLGSGTIDVAAGPVTITTINAGSNSVTLQGASLPTITNPIVANGIGVNGFTTTLSMASNTGGLSVGANPGGTAGSGTAGQVGTVTATGNIAGALAVSSGSTASVSGNVGGGLSLTAGTATFTGAGTTKTVTGPVSLDNGTVNATGTLDFGSTILSATAPVVVAGLREAVLSGAFDITSTNTSNVVKLGPVQANIAGNNSNGWLASITYAYTGEFYVPDNNGDGTGSFAFAENFDDSVRVAIDGVQRLSNPTYNDATGTGKLTLTAGWHTIDLRFGNGTSGAGPTTSEGWSGLGFGIDLDNTSFDATTSTTNPVQAQYVAALDNGTMNLFRTTLQSHLNVAASSTIKAGGVTNLGSVNFNGTNSALELVANGSANASSVATVTVAASSSGTINVAEAGDSVTAGSLNLTGTFTKSGEGTLAVSGSSTGTGAITVTNGTFVVDGSVGGNVTASGDSVIGGGGSIVGSLTLQGTSVLAPGNSPGDLATGALNLGATSTLRMELGGTVAGTQYDQLLVTGTLTLGGSTLQASLINGYSPANIGDTFFLILNDGTDLVSGQFAGLGEGAIFGINGLDFQITYQANGDFGAVGNDVALIAQVPEPGSALLLLGGIGSVVAMRRRRRNG